MDAKRFAVVTGGSSGIGLELARCCAKDGYDLLIAADEPLVEEAAEALKREGGEVATLLEDLSTTQGVDRLVAAVGTRPVDALLANAGHGLGKAFLDQEFDDARHVVDTNVLGTIYLVHALGRRMRARGEGRILITGSIAGFMPGTFQAVYNGSKAFLDSFSYALRNELKESGVTVTCLMPGATDTHFFERAGMLDTKVGQGRKDDPADVAQAGYKAMQDGDAGIVYGMKNKLEAAMTNLMPDTMLAEQHRKQAEPGSARGEGGQRRGMHRRAAP